MSSKCQYIVRNLTVLDNQRWIGNSPPQNMKGNQE